MDILKQYITVEETTETLFSIIIYDKNHIKSFTIINGNCYRYVVTDVIHTTYGIR